MLEDNLELVAASWYALNDERVLVGIVLDDDVVHVEDDALLRLLVDAVNLTRRQLVLHAQLKSRVLEKALPKFHCSHWIRKVKEKCNYRFSQASQIGRLEHQRIIDVAVSLANVEQDAIGIVGSFFLKMKTLISMVKLRLE